MNRNYEQKYKEALSRARDMLSYKEVRQEDMEYLFPELKESEDERIRKEIIRIVDGYFPDKASTQRAKYIAWLEKRMSTQSQYKPTKEHIEALKSGINCLAYYGINDDDLVLTDLLKDLEQL